MAQEFAGTQPGPGKHFIAHHPLSLLIPSATFRVVNLHPSRVSRVSAAFGESGLGWVRCKSGWRRRLRRRHEHRLAFVNRGRCRAAA